MRALILLFGLLATACAGRSDQGASIQDCAVQGRVQEDAPTSWVEVGTRGATWSRNSEAANVYLTYGLNLDPYPTAERRAYGGLSDHGRLRVDFRDQYPPGPPSESYNVEAHADGLTMTRRGARGHAEFSGPELDLILGGASDIELLLRNSQGEIVRQDQITRNELNQVDGLIRTLSARLPELFADPARFCPPDEIVV